MVGRFCVASIILLSSTAQAGTMVREPTSAWNVDFGASQCTASRNYGSAERPLYLVLKPSPLGGVMRLVVVQRGKIATAQTEGKLSFDGKPPLRPGILTYTDDKTRHRAVSVNVAMADFKANVAARSVSLWGPSFSETFVVSMLPDVTTELEKCLLALQQKWNIGTADRHLKVVDEAKPKAPLHSYFHSRDYPFPALRDAQSGLVRMVLLVDEKGAVSDCSVDATSAVPSLDAMSCYVLQQRVKFQPAIGGDGQPTKSAFCQSVMWATSTKWQPYKPPARPDPDPRCPTRI